MGFEPTTKCLNTLCSTIELPIKVLAVTILKLTDWQCFSPHPASHEGIEHLGVFVQKRFFYVAVTNLEKTGWIFLLFSLQ